MSILDHNSQYEITDMDSMDGSGFGKFFWFSGSMKRQKKKDIMRARAAAQAQLEAPDLQQEPLQTPELPPSPPPSMGFEESVPQPLVENQNFSQPEFLDFEPTENDHKSPSMDFQDELIQEPVVEKENFNQPEFVDFGPGVEAIVESEGRRGGKRAAGTYFKLNGSFDDDEYGDSDLTSDESDDKNGGRWFGVSVRQHRAESMQNLLKIAPQLMNNDKKSPTHEPEQQRTRNTLSDPRDHRYEPRDNRYNQQDNGYDPHDNAYNPRENGHIQWDNGHDTIDNVYNPHDKRSDPRDNGYDVHDNRHDPRDNRYEPRDHRYDPHDHPRAAIVEDDFIPESSILQEENVESFNDHFLLDASNGGDFPDSRMRDECVDDENDISIAEKMLEDFDAQFLEIEKIAMESFEDIDFTVPKKTPTKKNNRFGVNGFDGGQGVAPSTKIMKPPTAINARNHITGDLQSESLNEDERQEPPKRPSKPVNYERHMPKTATSQAPVPSPSQTRVESPLRDARKPVPVDDFVASLKHIEPVQKAPPMTPNTPPSDRKTSPRSPTTNPPLMNGHAGSTPNKQHRITVSSPGLGEKEYKLGETIHLQVNVRDKKKSHELPSDEVFDKQQEQGQQAPRESHKESETKEKPKDKESKPLKQNTRREPTTTQPYKEGHRRNRQRERPKSVAERISSFESNQPSSPPQQPVRQSNRKPLQKQQSEPEKKAKEGSSIGMGYGRKPSPKQQKKLDDIAPRESIGKPLHSQQEKPFQVEEELVVMENVKDNLAVNDNEDLLGDLGEDFIDMYLKANESPDASHHEEERVRESITDSDLFASPTPSYTPTPKAPITKTPSEPPPRLLLKRQMHISSTSSTSSLPGTTTSTGADGDQHSHHHHHRRSHSSQTEDSRSEFDSSDDDSNQKLTRNRSFRRSIIIEDGEVSVRRKKSIGGTSVSVAFIAINKKPGEKEGKVTVHQRLKGILNFLDNMVLDDESLGLYYDSVRQLHTVYWDLKGAKNEDSNSGNEGETLSSALNFLVVHEWPKVMLGCIKKLKAAYPHVFQEEETPEVR